MCLELACINHLLLQFSFRPNLSTSVQITLSMSYSVCRVDKGSKRGRERGGIERESMSDRESVD